MLTLQTENMRGEDSKLPETFYPHLNFAALFTISEPINLSMSILSLAKDLKFKIFKKFVNRVSQKKILFKKTKGIDLINKSDHFLQIKILLKKGSVQHNHNSILFWFSTQILSNLFCESQHLIHLLSWKERQM